MGSLYLYRDNIIFKFQIGAAIYEHRTRHDENNN